MWEIFWFIVFVILMRIYSYLERCNKKYDYFFFVNNDGRLDNWFMDFICVLSIFVWKLIAHPHGLYSLETIVQLILCGYMVSGIYSVVAYVGFGGKIPMGRLWAFAAKGGAQRTVLVFVAFCLLAIFAFH